VRILRAFLWLRWRVLINTLERTGARDTVERFSLAIEQLGPIMAAVMMIPSAILLAGGAAFAGWTLAQGAARPAIAEAMRFLLLGVSVLTIAGPLLFSANSSSNAVRLLLLPIPRRTLYAVQAASALLDPWLFLAVPVVAALPVGLAIGGAFGAAIVAAAAGILLLATLVGLASVVSSLVQLVVRDRRRGEILTLVFVLVLPIIGFLPSMLAGEERRTRAERRAEPRGTPAWIATIERRVLPVVPSEMFVRATRASVRGESGEALRSLASLALGAGLLHAAGLLTFSLVLGSPASTGARRGGPRRRARAWKIPWLAPQTSAVALSQFRMGLRTPRGRSTLLSPAVVFAVFAVMMWRGGMSADFGPIAIGSGLGLAAFGAFVSLVSILPFTANQFAIDGAGLTLEFLSPIGDRELLHGKAIGNAAIAAVPATFCVVAAAALFPGAGMWMWTAIPLGIAAAYLLVSPAAALLSAVFPRPVDLNSIGRNSNAHGLAAFVGFLAYAAASGLSLLVSIITSQFLGRPDLTPLVMLAWCAAAGAAAWLLFIPVSAIVARRRENLVMLRSI
jgi:hypothetical protein